MITANPLLGTFFHAIGGLCASVFYTPHHKARRWSWETYWLTQASFSWLILPIVGAMITIPHLMVVLAEAPKSAMLHSWLLGMAYGIGGTMFGMAIRYIGYSLTYSIAVGLSSVLGTILPILMDGKMSQVIHKPGGLVVLAGVALGAVGIGLCGFAGLLKERDLDVKTAQVTEFSLAKGVPLCLVSGVLAAVFGFALIAGQPIADVAAKHGAGIWQGNVIYIFAMSGAFVSTSIYCLILGIKNKTLGEFRALGEKFQSHLSLNYVLAAIGGALWYLQFFFYGLGHVRMGSYKFSSWAIHMVLLIFFSSLLGLMMKEWKFCKRRSIIAINIALAVLIIAVLVIGYGNYIGEAVAQG